jgi:hypothetical protein
MARRSRPSKGPRPHREVVAAVDALPLLQLDDVARAMQSAGKQLSREKEWAFHGHIMRASNRYFVDAINERLQANPSRAADLFSRISAKADDLAALLEINPEIREDISAQHDRLGEPQRRLLLRKVGEERLKGLIDAVLQLQTAARQIHLEERGKLKKPRAERRTRNVPMHNLFCDIDSAWNEAFGKPPGLSSGGPYMRFLASMLGSMRARAGNYLASEHQDILSDLPPAQTRMRWWARSAATSRTQAKRKAGLQTPPRKANANRVGLERWWMAKSRTKNS